MNSEALDTVDEEGWSEWEVPAHTGYRMMCCDCGQVHEMDFRIRGRNQVLFRVRVDYPLTRKARRTKRLAGVAAAIRANR